MSIINNLFRLNAFTRKELKGLTKRSQFSTFLPYRSYSEEENEFHNVDDSVSFIWECSPLVFANEEVSLLFEGLLNSTMYPENAVMQIILFADPDVQNILNGYRYCKPNPDELAEETIKHVSNFFNEGTEGFPKMSGVPCRNFRLFVTIKIPKKKMSQKGILDIRNNIQEILAGAYLSPRKMSAEDLINVLAGILNDDKIAHIPYNPNMPINKQIISSETPIVEKWDKVHVGKKIFRCQTVKKWPIEVDNMFMNSLMGDSRGIVGDGRQINSPFILTVNLVFQDLSSSIHGKCNLILNQQAFGSLATTIERKKKEYLFATDELEKGTRFLRVMPIIWHYSTSEEDSQEVDARVRNIWGGKGVTTQRDRGILKVLLLSALPCGLYTDESTVDYIDRDNIMHPAAAAKVLPIQADFKGGGSPQCLFVGRKGQLVTFDLFSKDADNYNMLVCASSGKGKTFLMNSILSSYLMSGATLKITDIGRGYLKLCKMSGGRFIEFTPSNHEVSLNPFAKIRNINDDLAPTSAIIQQMAYSSTRQKPSETECTLIDVAIKLVFSKVGNEGRIDDVYDILRSPTSAFTSLEDLENLEGTTHIDIKTLATKLAFNLKKFTSDGDYGRWFNKIGTLGLEKDQIVVLELEELKPQPALLNVVTLQLINDMTSSLYLADRTKSVNQLLVFDEAWQFFGEETAILAKMIEEGYRRARKYKGSFTTITQSLLDLGKFGKAGEVIFANSDHKMLLESADFDQALNRKIINYSPFVMDLLRSVKSKRPDYSEIFMDTPVGVGIARLMVDDFTYYKSTSAKEENAEIERLVQHHGLSYKAAFNYLLDKKIAGQQAA